MSTLDYAEGQADASPPVARSTPASAQLLHFSGTAGAYFGIWIVNLMLTVVTLGIYSAWAKVRTRRYFYRNTTLAGERFDYHAKPTAILVGRLIGAALFGSYLAVVWLAPGWELIPIALIFFGTPWLLMKGAAFNARSSSYRNVRFSFHGGLGAAYAAFVGWPILGALTLLGLMPIALHRQAQWKLDNHRFGNLPFRFGASSGPYFGVFWKALGIVVLGMLAMVVWIFGAMLIVGVLGGSEGLGENPSADPAVVVAVLPAYAVLMLAYAAAGAFFASRLLTVGLGSTTLDGHPFYVGVKAREVLWIYVTNSLAIMFSLGLAFPWAKVRAVRYQLERIALDIDEASIQQVVAQGSAQTSAIGEEVADAFDVEFDFGL